MYFSPRQVSRYRRVWEREERKQVEFIPREKGMRNRHHWETSLCYFLHLQNNLLLYNALSVTLQSHSSAAASSSQTKASHSHATINGTTNNDSNVDTGSNSICLPNYKVRNSDQGEGKKKFSQL